MNRESQLAELTRRRFDLVVVGGGITGACLAYDAATRGLRVALVERDDFGGATSSASSKLLHGGIRYLQQLRLAKVRESALERIYFQNLVPHLCHYVPFLIPAFKSVRQGRPALRCAALAYSLLCAGQNREARLRSSEVPPTRAIGPDELFSLMPILSSRRDVAGGLVLPECHMRNSERVTFALISGAVCHGATVANYVSGVGLERRGSRVTGLIIRDVESGQDAVVRAKVVANCAGPWIKSFSGAVLGKHTGPITGFSRGSHIIVTGLNLRCAVALPTGEGMQGVAGRGGRHVFLIPWRDHSLVGTSYSRHEGSLKSVKPTESDIKQLTNGVNSAVGSELIVRDKIVHAFAGIYPLTARAIQEGIYQGTGSYKIVDHSKTDGIHGFVSVLGAKFTTARLLAEKVCDQVVPLVSRKTKNCTTRTRPVPSGEYDSLDVLVSDLAAEFRQVVSRELVHRLVRDYGTDSRKILEIVRQESALGEKISAHRETIAAEVVHGARSELAHRLEDILFRRTGIGTLGHPGHQAVEKCADLMATEKGWSEAQTNREIARANQYLQLPFLGRRDLR